MLCLSKILEMIAADPGFFDRVVTGDTTVFQYDPETKRQSVVWKTPSYLRPRERHFQILDQKYIDRVLRSDCLN